MTDCLRCEGTGIGHNFDSSCTKCLGKGYILDEYELAQKEIAEEERFQTERENLDE